jgi:hypothetical protein
LPAIVPPFVLARSMPERRIALPLSLPTSDAAENITATPPVAPSESGAATGHVSACGAGGT